MCLKNWWTYNFFEKTWNRKRVCFHEKKKTRKLITLQQICFLFAFEQFLIIITWQVKYFWIKELFSTIFTYWLITAYLKIIYLFKNLIYFHDFAVFYFNLFCKEKNFLLLYSSVKSHIYCSSSLYKSTLQSNLFHLQPKTVHSFFFWSNFILNPNRNKKIQNPLPK